MVKGRLGNYSQSHGEYLSAHRVLAGISHCKEIVMATIVTGDRYMLLDGKLHEINRQMRQKGGYPFDLEKLDTALQAIVEGRFEAVGGQFPSVVLAGDLLLEGMTVVDDIAPTADLDVTKLMPKSFLQSGDPGWINGETLRARSIEKKGRWSLADGKKMLADGGKLIPAAFRPYYIPLTGTKLRDSGGCLYFAYLVFGGGRWCLDFDRLGGRWHDGGRLACSE